MVTRLLRSDFPAVIALVVAAACGRTPTSPATMPGVTQLTAQGGSKTVFTEGTVSGLTGSCPTIAFGVNYTTVTTSAQTAFTEVPCDRVQNGMSVEVLGSMPPDGRVIAATTVDCGHESAAEEIVSGLMGSCPTLTFAVNGTTVRTTAQTAFWGVTCSGLRNGLKVHVQGGRQADGSILAVAIVAD